MDAKRKTLIAAALAVALPVSSHIYMRFENAAVSAYQQARARASVWLLDRLQRPYDLRLLVEM